MLKTSYSTQEEIPENMRGAYVLSGGKWILDELSSDHPIVAKKDELLTENASQKRKVTRLENEKSALESDVLPDGHVAVPKAKAELLDKLEPFGSPVEVVTKLAEHKTLKDESETRKRSDHLRAVAKELEYEPEAFVLLQGLPEFEIRDGQDGKKQVIAKVKDGNTIVEKPAAEYVESSPQIAPLLPALKAQPGGVRVHGSRSNNGAPAKDVYTQIRERAAEKQKQTSSDLHPMFKQIPGRMAQTGE